MKNGFCKTSWFVGLVISLTLLLTANSAFSEELACKAHDLTIQASERDAGDKVTIIQTVASQLAVSLKQANNTILAMRFPLGELLAIVAKNTLPKIFCNIGLDKRLTKGQNVPEALQCCIGQLT